MPALLRAVSDKLPDWLLRTKVGQAIVEEIDKLGWDEREAVINRVATQRRELPAVALKHDKAIEPHEAAARASKKKAEEDAQKVLAAQKAKVRAVDAVLFAIKQDEILLARTADNAAIDEAHRAIFAKFNAQRSGMGNWKEVRVPGQVDGMGRQAVRHISNQVAIQRLLKAQDVAYAALTALRLKNPPNLSDAIAAIVAPVNEAWRRIEELDDIAGGPMAA